MISVFATVWDTDPLWLAWTWSSGRMGSSASAAGVSSAAGATCASGTGSSTQATRGTSTATDSNASILRI